jgi:protein OS-9
MTHADSIYLVKELATCSYVLVIHSPHLCELPGFKPATATGAVERVKCRLVVGDDDVVSGHDQGQASTKPVGRETRQPALAAAPAVDPIPESDTQLSRSEDALERLIELLHLAPDSQSEVEITSLLEDAIGGEFVSDEERDQVAEGSKLELLRSLLATLGAEVEIRIHDEHHDQEEDEERRRDEL